VVICLKRDAKMHAAQLMPMPLTVSCFSKIQIVFTFLVPAHPGIPGQRAAKRVCVCVCVCVCFVMGCVNVVPASVRRRYITTKCSLPAGARVVFCGSGPLLPFWFACRCLADTGFGCGDGHCCKKSALRTSKIAFRNIGSLKFVGPFWPNSLKS